MRLAYVSPLPPATSGIADYSVDLLPALAARAEVTVYPEEGGRLPPDLAGRMTVRPLGSLAADVAAGRCERVLYQLGNSAPHHAGAWPLLSRVPGVVVLHEYLLHHLVRDLTLLAGDAAAWTEALRAAAGRSGERAGQLAASRGRRAEPWDFPLFEPVVDCSRGVLVHSAFARRRIRESRPAARIGLLPMPCRVDPPPPAEVERTRREIGLEPDDPLFATFGLLTPHKHLAPALGAFARLRRELPRARFLLVGEVSPHYELAADLSAAGQEGVEVTGRVPLARLHALMAATDVAVNLRHPTGGETSATLFRLLGLGCATVVTDAGSFAELPAGCVARVAVDQTEEDHLLVLFRRLARDRPLREEMGACARRHVLTAHSPARTAEVCLDFVARVGGQPPLAPASPARTGGVYRELLADLAGDLLAAGLGERDRAALEIVAAAVVDLDLDPVSETRGGEGR